MSTPNTNHVIILYPALVKRLRVRAWVDACIQIWPTFTKQHGKYVYIAVLNHVTNRATFTRYERLSQ